MINTFKKIKERWRVSPETQNPVLNWHEKLNKVDTVKQRTSELDYRTPETDTL